MKFLLGLLLLGMLTLGIFAYLWVSPTKASMASPSNPALESVGTDHGDHIHCPPCGMDVPADSPKHEIEGLTFAFCSERCQEVVAADPQSFVTQAIARSGQDQ